MALVSSSTSSPRTRKKQSSASSANYLGIIQPEGFPALPIDWNSEWEQFPSSDGVTKLFSVTHHEKEWKNPRALIVLHGGGEHGGRYLHFPHFLKETIGAVHAMDFRGHGRSEGLRGHIEDWNQHADDAILGIQRFEAKMRGRFKKFELHLFAHSMGGLIALQALLKHPNLPLTSVSISAPLLGLGWKVPFAKKAVAGVLARAWPSLQLSSGLSSDSICGDPAVVKTYGNDRLVHDKVTPRAFDGMTSAMEGILHTREGWNYNVQFYIPLQDKVVDSEAALAFYRNLNYRNKSLKTYPGFFHESFNEREKEKAFEDLRQWILKNSEST